MKVRAGKVLLMTRFSSIVIVLVLIVNSTRSFLTEACTLRSKTPRKLANGGAV
jgi:hypothetical protein